MNVAIITDSFPPMIDGVSRCALGYAKALHEGGYGNCIVIAPRMPRLKYNYPFPVYGFRSIRIPYDNYRAGHPFTPRLARKLKSLEIDILHAHSPFISMTLARELRRYLDVPIVYTQHTKWDYDIERAVSSKLLQKQLERYVYKNISKANEVWAVSRGAGEHLISRGYAGDFLVMPNATDFPQGTENPELRAQIDSRFDLPDGVPILLFVGRMVWYKNIGLILDALELLKESGFDFRMLMVGDGRDVPEMIQKTAEKGLTERVFFAGRVNDREVLMSYFMRSDLFLLVSTYDNAPLVVREAAACALPSLVLQGSSTAEIIDDGINGFLSRESAVDVAEAIKMIFSDREHLKTVSEAAQAQVYLPWNKAVEIAVERYKVVMREYRGSASDQ